MRTEPTLPQPYVLQWLVKHDGFLPYTAWKYWFEPIEDEL